MRIERLTSCSDFVPLAGAGSGKQGDHARMNGKIVASRGREIKFSAPVGLLLMLDSSCAEFAGEERRLAQKSSRLANNLRLQSTLKS